MVTGGRSLAADPEHQTAFTIVNCGSAVVDGLNPSEGQTQAGSFSPSWNPSTS